MVFAPLLHDAAQAYAGEVRRDLAAPGPSLAPAVPYALRLRDGPAAAACRESKLLNGGPCFMP
jgi:hypothetical protein